MTMAFSFEPSEHYQSDWLLCSRGGAHDTNSCPWEVCGISFMVFLKPYPVRNSGQLALDWGTLMKIASGVSKGLSYLHNRADPPVIYRDLKSSKILLGDGFHPKISDFITAESAPFDDQSTVTAVIMANCAPEYPFPGGLTSKLDVFSFGMVLLVLIMGRGIRVVKTKAGRYNVDVDRYMREKDVRELADLEMKGRFKRICLREPWHWHQSVQGYTSCFEARHESDDACDAMF
ncbi:serine/threonine-protein kinase pbs1 [Phtheirospermum japonicum]|uniref:Serine/threonine-protein kinase pbs1 n=1 Tax=Phtheirospermum japonicum TaxID=374723 RepID=A0A830DD74_9LAMI|nr:serine/threonine-protein kinase pbs1 [Phtheirospermum japonicum]